MVHYEPVSSERTGENMSVSNLSRRAFLGMSGSAVALAGLGLAACGSDSASSDNANATGTANSTDVTGAEPQNGSPATTPLDQLPLPEEGKVYNNPLDRDQIQDGGTLTLPAGEIGPNWNYLSIEGNTAEMHNMWDWYMPTNLFVSDATASKFEPNPNFVTKAETKDEGGKQTLTLDINPDAKFNDGTPIDYRAFQAVWTVMNGTNPDYTPAATDGYDRIESVEKGDSDKQVVITTSNPVYPAEALFNLVIHPDAADPDVFNSGWNNNPHADDWGYGPYTVDSFDTTQVTFVPNPNWWGDAPKLESVTYKQMDSQALFNAFKNGEIDATGQAQSGSQEMLSNFSSMDDAEIRRANSLSIANIEINSTRGVLTDENVRKAFVQCLDIPTLRSVVFQGVNWEEDVPGSLLTPTWADGYENNMPDDVTSLTTADERTAAAKKTLEDAGYALDDDGYYAKDGTEVAFSFTTFGDSNTVKNRAAAIIKMAKDAGIKIDQDAKPSSEFSTTLTSGSWDICLFGWVSTPTSVWNGPQIYGSDSPSNFTHLGSADLDAELAKIISIEDHTEQMKALNAAEKKALASYGFIPLYAGPDVVVTKKGLANYGPALYLTVSNENIGWAK